LRHNLSKFITQTGLYCSKQLETTFCQFCEKPLHISFAYHIAKQQIGVCFAAFFVDNLGKPAAERLTILNGARDDGVEWHQLDHIQIICTLLQTDYHARLDALPATQSTVSKH